MRSEFRGWLPYQLRPGTETVDCRWLYVGETKFTDPFFEDTIARCLSLPENSFGPPRITRLDELPEIACAFEALEPAALIFHVSRCGSTLLSQLLDLNEACVTLSEVPFFDQLLRARYDSQLAETVDVATHFPAAMRLYGQRRSERERLLVVKLDSWQVGFHAELRALYPRTPFVLLYREPGAVIRSHRKRPGMHAVPGVIEDAVFGFAPGDESVTPETHLARVLEFYYESFLEMARTDAHCLLLPYRSDMMSAVESIARFCRIEMSPAQATRMRERASFHGKYPDEKFEEESPGSEVGPEWEKCLARYKALEGFRLSSTR